jgi:hypothetical protein
MNKIVGVRISNFNATWPLALIRVDREKILIRIMFFYKIVIQRNSVISVAEYDLIPIIGKGIIINLKEPKKFGTMINETDRIIIWSLTKRKTILEELKK